jgi:hypothetical protein
MTDCALLRIGKQRCIGHISQRCEQAKRETGALLAACGFESASLAVIAGPSSVPMPQLMLTIAEHGYSRIVLDSLPVSIAEAD